MPDHRQDSPNPSAYRPGADTGDQRSSTRRTLLKRGLLAGGVLIGGGGAISELAGSRGSSRSQRAPQSARASVSRPTNRPPNILVILVDQLRSDPRWISRDPLASGLMPNLLGLAREGVSFASHYTAANDCTPSRSTLLTGLYTHQTGCMITGGSTLDPGFPTWGGMLREQGYLTNWYGKWHLTHHDNEWSALTDARALESYGFSGGTYPSPDGAPGQGWRVDPRIVSQFQGWFAAAGREEPWCTTVSLVNPHDIAWWYRWSDRFADESAVASLTRGLPVNFETPEQMIRQGKPRLQRSLQETAAHSFGPVPFTGPTAAPRWSSMLDLYAKLRREVDRHIGLVLQTLSSRPEVAANTVVLFTSDHGEYGGAHGLRGKGAGAYEEAIRVPLIVKDPRGVLTSSPQLIREQLTSSIDVAPLLLSIATGSEAWRDDSHYAHLADRLDMARILADPGAPGRGHILHATDEIVTEFAEEPYAWNAPLHVVALRIANAKFATYSNWRAGSTEDLSAGQESELYDYRTRSGRLELHNGASHSRLEESLRERLRLAIERELRGELPHRLRHARARGFRDYFQIATHAARGAAAARLRHAQLELQQSRSWRPGERERTVRE